LSHFIPIIILLCRPKSGFHAIAVGISRRGDNIFVVLTGKID
jgi:hypothetical protein